MVNVGIKKTQKKQATNMTEILSRFSVREPIITTNAEVAFGIHTMPVE